LIQVESAGAKCDGISSMTHMLIGKVDLTIKGVKAFGKVNRVNTSRNSIL